MTFETLSFDDFCSIEWSGFSVLTGCGPQQSFMVEAMEWSSFAPMSFGLFTNSYFKPDSVPWHIEIVSTAYTKVEQTDYKISNILVHTL